MAEERTPTPFEEVRAITRSIGKRLDEFNGRTLDGEVAKQYAAIREDYREAVRQVYAYHGWVEGPPDRFDTSEKILVWLEWEDYARRTAIVQHPR